MIAIKLIPGMSAEILHLLTGEYAALVIEIFGVGGIPSNESEAFKNALRDLKTRGTKIIITTQVTHEGSDMSLYEVGSIKQSLGLIEARDMTVEAIMGKTVWALAASKTDEEFEKLFKTPVGMEKF